MNENELADIHRRLEDLERRLGDVARSGQREAAYFIYKDYADNPANLNSMTLAYVRVSTLFGQAMAEYCETRWLEELTNK